MFRAGLKYSEAVEQSNRNDLQETKAKIRSRKFYDEILTKHNGFLMDDVHTSNVISNSFQEQKFLKALVWHDTQ